MLIHPKDKIPKQLHQDVVYQWTCPEENCNSSYIGESSQCLESRVKKHNPSPTSTIFQHSIANNHPKAYISQFTVIDQDRKQVCREAMKATHVRKNNAALNHNVGEVNIPEIFNQVLETYYSSSTDVSTNPNDQNNNPSSNKRPLGHYTYTINWNTPTISTLILLSKVLVHPPDRYIPTPFIKEYSSYLNL